MTSLAVIALNLASNVILGLLYGWTCVVGWGLIRVGTVKEPRPSRQIGLITGVMLLIVMSFFFIVWPFGLLFQLVTLIHFWDRIPWLFGASIAVKILWAMVGAVWGLLTYRAGYSFALEHPFPRETAFPG